MFSIKFKFDKIKVDAKARRINENESNYFEDDCLLAIIILISESLAQNDNIIFEVKGFDTDWPVDICTDLSTAIIQVYEAIILLRNSNKATIQFYEQGIEKTLEFHRSRQCVFIDCVSLMEDEIFGSREKHTWGIFEKMLIEFLLNYIQCVQHALPKCYENIYFTEFAEKVSEL